MEVLTAKNAAGGFGGAMLSVPARCGLKQADTLQIHEDRMFAIRRRSVLPIDLPKLTAQSRASLIAHAAGGQRLPVAEFTPLGLLDAYFLNLDIVS